MVYALIGGDVREPVVRDSEILTINEQQILANAAEYQAKSAQV